ncbi:MAG: hypothetical protein R2830_21505 [Saprospiraceae bacterium]
MTDKRKLLRQRWTLLLMQLEVYRRYPESFWEALGKKGTEAWLNGVLDEINDIRRELQVMGEEPG